MITAFDSLAAQKRKKLLFSLLQTSLEAKTKVELLERWGH